MSGAADVRAQRAWLLSPEAGFGGDGETVPCYWCERTLHFKVEGDRDRFPVCGHAGGGYTRGNIVPSCALCNRRRCTKNRRCTPD